jgi:hypothetical protein
MIGQFAFLRNFANWRCSYQASDEGDVVERFAWNALFGGNLKPPPQARDPLDLKRGNRCSACIGQPQVISEIGLTRTAGLKCR